MLNATLYLTKRGNYRIMQDYLLLERSAQKSLNANEVMHITSYYDSEEFNNEMIYKGDDLGVTYLNDQIQFKIWAPIAEYVTLLLYKKAHSETPIYTFEMNDYGAGVYEYSLPLLYDGFYYLFEVKNGDHFFNTPGPEVKVVGINGEKGYLCDLATTDPEGFRETEIPKLKNAVDAVIYEVHVRDFTMHHESGAEDKGNFLAFIQKGTKNSDHMATGIDHLKELGVTHVQLLPIYDYNCLDEAAPKEEQYNWGYDPLNYNAVEGSYSSNPKDPALRIKELKTLIMELHKNGIGVIMDVVYNHTSDQFDANFHKSAPYYYHRTEHGLLTNASGCGNETATERFMMKQFMINSLLYWVQEFKIDGFRFDLMGIHDIQTMKEVSAALKAEKEDILLYGEGWSGGYSPLHEDLRLVKRNLNQVPTIGGFNDDFRDAIKGHVFYDEAGGFVQGKGFRESIKFGIVGSVYHDNIDYDYINYTDFPWANNPGQSINYASAHDNLTLYDKIKASVYDKDDEAKIKRMAKLANALVLTSQGVPFLHAGVEFLRTKFGDANSYRSPDSINALNWKLKTKNYDVFSYYKGLIELRKTYKHFRLDTQEAIAKHLHFYKGENAYDHNLVAYTLDSPDDQNPDTFFIAFNGNQVERRLNLGDGTWDILVDANQAGTTSLGQVSGHVDIAPTSTLVLIKTK